VTRIFRTFGDWASWISDAADALLTGIEIAGAVASVRECSILLFVSCLLTRRRIFRSRLKRLG
jgi:hypothetical protein